MITARLRNPTVTLEAPMNERQQEGVSLRVNVLPSPLQVPSKGGGYSYT